MELSGVIAPAKLATQKFEKSKDYKVCPYLSELISKNMLCYELSIECFQLKVMKKSLSPQFKAIIKTEFSEQSGVGSDSFINKVWQKAYSYSDEIENILMSSDTE
jgi:hypothetical protein